MKAISYHKPHFIVMVSIIILIFLLSTGSGLATSNRGQSASSLMLEWSMDIPMDIPISEAAELGLEGARLVSSVPLVDKLQKAGVTFNQTPMRTVEGGFSSRLKASGKGGVEDFRHILFRVMKPEFNPLGGVTEMEISGATLESLDLDLILEANPSTGYAWHLVTDGAFIERAPSVHEMVSIGFGLPQKQTLRLSLGSTATGTIKLVYRRAWEEDTSPTRYMTLKLSSLPPELNLSDPDIPVAQQPFSTDSYLKTTELPAVPVTALPSSFDWRTQNIVTPVKDQGQCGSCWAFGTVSVMESAVLKAGGPVRDFSEQFLVSCNNDGYSCNGGFAAHKYHYDTLGKNQTSIGAVLEADKPYTATNGSCTSALSHYEKLNAWAYVKSNIYDIATVDEIKNAIYTYGVVTTGVCVGNAFQAYTGGIFNTDEKSSCYSGGSYSANHLVSLVGWDDTGQYFIMKNSWGSSTGWGESGYMRIHYNISLIGQHLSWATVATSQLATPTFSPAAGTYAGSVTVTISCATSGATIRYTTDGTDPTSSSTLYSSALTFTTTTILKARAFKSGLADSAVASGTYTITTTQKVATPTFSPAAGTYAGSVTVTISCVTSGATIRYTTDGTDPTSSSTLYSSTLIFTTTITLKARAFMGGMTDSEVASGAYTITGASSLNAALDNSTLTFSTGGDAAWYGQASTYYYGNSAAQSGDIADYQTSWLQTTVTGPGTLSFFWKVSSEAGYDFLKFYVDSNSVYQISGIVDWQQKTYVVPSGSHTLKWAYIKDYSVSSNSDSGWLDKVEFNNGAIITAPTVTTNAASGVTASGATLNGTVNANNGSTTVTFQYGTTTAYGSTVTADQSPVTGNSNTAVSKAITGLTLSATYHYRVVAANSAGTSYGSDSTFTTLGSPAAATLITPWGTMSLTSPTYYWSAVPNASQYNLLVNDSTGTKVNQSYSAAEAGCASGTGICSVTPSAVLAMGSGNWQIQTQNSYGLGPWSSALNFNIVANAPKVDFSGDGKTDILWHNKTNGDVSVWYMNGATLISGASIYRGVPLDWEIVGTSDFNNDGKPDILWHNKVNGDVNIWYMNGATLISGASIYQGVSLSWEIMGTGDFNNDGKPDLLWRNKTSGAIAVWYMNGITPTGAAVIASNSDLNWDLLGSGDFNNDGKTDLLWRQKNIGMIAVWYMNGVTPTGTAVIAGSSDLNWDLLGSGDFNNDGKTDLLWRQKNIGMIAVWYMNGVTPTGTAVIAGSSDLNWTIVDP